jgi:hypothetical protein
MTVFSKAAGYGGILFAALVTATPALSGTGECIVNKLGANASAISYWVNEPSGWHVVTTVDTKSLKTPTTRSTRSSASPHRYCPGSGS